MSDSEVREAMRKAPEPEAVDKFEWQVTPYHKTVGYLQWKREDEYERTGTWQTESGLMRLGHPSGELSAEQRSTLQPSIRFEAIAQPTTTQYRDGWMGGYNVPYRVWFDDDFPPVPYHVSMPVAAHAFTPPAPGSLSAELRAWANERCFGPIMAPGRLRERQRQELMEEIRIIGSAEYAARHAPHGPPPTY